MSIQQTLFGNMPDGTPIHLYTMSGDGISVSVIEYGARIARLQVDGIDVVCGFDSLDGYLADKDYHGSIVGRYANRIADGKFSLHGKTYQLAHNEVGRAHLHGGNVGYSSRVWDLSLFESITISSLPSADKLSARAIPKRPSPIIQKSSRFADFFLEPKPAESSVFLFIFFILFFP